MGKCVTVICRCEEFARQGCKVYATSRRVESISDFSNESIERLALDVTSDDSVRNALNFILDKEGKIDVVVNNAGMSAPGPLVEQSLDRVKKLFDTNTFGVLRICNAVVPIMAKRHSGIIVNIGSVMGNISSPWTGVYCASKAALNSISEVLHMELRPLGIHVLHVTAGGVKSNIAANGLNGFSLPEDTLYGQFVPNIIDRVNASQDHASLRSEEFARRVVANALKANPPRYMTLGGHSLMFSIIWWLPRSLVLYFFWKRFS